MTDKELRKLRRDDLLQILISQQRKIDEMTVALERSEKALADRSIAIEEAGSLAEASLRLNGVFEAAQSAADDYAAQMRRRADELAAEAEKKSGEAQRQAEELVRNARAEAERILRQAKSEAEALLARGGGAPEPMQNTEQAPSEDEGDGKRRRGLLWRSRKS